MKVDDKLTCIEGTRCKELVVGETYTLKRIWKSGQYLDLEEISSKGWHIRRFVPYEEPDLFLKAAKDMKFALTQAGDRVNVNASIEFNGKSYYDSNYANVSMEECERLTPWLKSESLAYLFMLALNPDKI